jgi:hypothetical protein
MIATIVRMFQPRPLQTTAEELKEYINRLFLIISRSRVLIERFERRLGGLSDADAVVVIDKLDVSAAIVAALEARLNGVLDAFNGKASLEELEALIEAPIAFVMPSGDEQSVSLDACAVKLERMLTDLNDEIHEKTPQSFYLRALARA